MTPESTARLHEILARGAPSALVFGWMSIQTDCSRTGRPRDSVSLVAALQDVLSTCEAPNWPLDWPTSSGNADTEGGHATRRKTAATQERRYRWGDLEFGGSGCFPALVLLRNIQRRGPCRAGAVFHCRGFPQTFSSLVNHKKTANCASGFGRPINHIRNPLRAKASEKGPASR